VSVSLAGVRTREIRSLTSLRGVAAFWVLLHHLAGSYPKAFPAFSTLFIERGYLAVDLFFVLSGFVMALTYRGMFERQPVWSAYPDFLVRRIARVVPLNAAVILGIGVVVAFLGPRVSELGGCAPLAGSLGHLIANMLLVQEWGFSCSINPPAWSVSVEMAAYVAFPLLLALAWSRLWPVMLVIAVSALVLQFDMAGLAKAYIRCFAGFFEGLICYRVYLWVASKRWLPWLEIAIVAALLAFIGWSAQLEPIVLLFPPLIVVLAAEQGWVGRFLRVRPLHYLGELSFALYLVHWGVIWLVHHGGIGDDRIGGPAIAITASLAVSMASYHLLERPARRIIRRLVEGMAMIVRAKTEPAETIS
jgi:peptidoglycan/LPS O-acetylase OafA/YrhL